MISNPDAHPPPLTAGLFVARLIDLDLHRPVKDESCSARPESSVAFSVPLFPVPCRSSRLAGCNPIGWEHLLLLQPHVGVAAPDSAPSDDSPWIHFTVSVGEWRCCSVFTIMCGTVVMIKQTLLASCIVPSTGCNTVCVFRYERQKVNAPMGVSVSDVAPEHSEVCVCVCVQVGTHSFLRAAAMVTLFFKDIARLSSSASCVAGGVGSREINLFFLDLFLNQ